MLRAIALIPADTPATADPARSNSAPRDAATRRFDLAPRSVATRCDAGRLSIAAAFVPLLQALHVDTFDALWNFSGGMVVRRVGPRETRRITLDTFEGPREFYLKRFGPPRWRDRLRTLLHLGWPIHGARPEWEAIRRFEELGIPTVVPVALGESGRRSLLVTEALPARGHLLELVGGREPRRPTSRDAFVARNARTILSQLADLTRRMHAAGWQHQDFYLNHLLLAGDEGSPRVHVIDLGRARRHAPLAPRWIVKDLAQLNFSAVHVAWPSRLRFLRLYLGRPFRPADRRLARRIAAKSQRIAAHTAKHGL